jgi:hypothetical protein
MVSNLDFLNHFLIFLFSFYVIFILGKIINSLFSFNFIKKFSIASNLFSGVLFIIIATSLLITSFKSIIILTVPIILFAIYHLKTIGYNLKISFNFTFNFKWDLIYPILLSSIIYIYQSYFYFDYFNNSVKELFIDNYIYGGLSKSLLDFHIENFDLDSNFFLHKNQYNCIPYRYGEMWLNSFFILLNNKSSVFNYYCVTISVLTTAVFSFYFQYLETTKLYLKLIISFLLLFVSVIFIPGLNEFKFISETCLMGVFQQKLALVFLFFLFGIYFFNRDRIISIIFFLFCPIFYVSYIPGIFGGIGVYLISITLYKFIKTSKVDYKNIYVLLLIFLLCILYVLFYKLFGSEILTKLSSPFDQIPIVKRLYLMKFNSELSITTNIIDLLLLRVPDILKYLYFSLQNLIIGSLFLLPYLYFVKSKINLKIFIFLFLIFFSGLASVVLNDGTMDNFQFYTNLLILFTIVISINLIDKMNSNGKINYFFFSIIILFVVIPVVRFKNQIGEFNKLDLVFLNNVKKELKKDNNCVLIFKSEGIKTRDFYDWTVIGNELLALRQLSNKNYYFSIANPNIFLKDNRLAKSDKLHFFHWTPIQNYLKGKDNKSKILGFIKKHKISSIFFQNANLLPKELIVLKKYKSKNGSYFAKIKL